jgi:hypothetical protein
LNGIKRGIHFEIVTSRGPFHVPTRQSPYESQLVPTQIQDSIYNCGGFIIYRLHVLPPFISSGSVTVGNTVVLSDCYEMSPAFVRWNALGLGP